MDPVASIISYFLLPVTERDEIRLALEEWYAGGGFHPTTADIKASLDKLPLNWYKSALDLGAIPTRNLRD